MTYQINDKVRVLFAHAIYEKHPSYKVAKITAYSERSNLYRIMGISDIAIDYGYWSINLKHQCYWLNPDMIIKKLTTLTKYEFIKLLIVKWIKQ